MENSVRSFKDAILKENHIVEGREKEYTYDQVMHLIKTSNEKPVTPKHSQAVYDYFDEKQDTIVEILESLKSRFALKGFANTMNLGDFLEVLMKNTSVEEVISDVDDQEMWMDDDDI